MTNFGRTPSASSDSCADDPKLQEANYRWWQSSPMRYDWKASLSNQEFSGEFFAEIDARFFGAVRHFMPWHSKPFEQLIPFDALSAMSVLEIGTGAGSHAQLLAPSAATYVGIDFTEYATRCTSRRMSTLGERASVGQMDAERLGFPNDTFDFVWSWGVIHHSANTERALKEISRVLKPGGRAVIMVYHKSFWTYYVLGVVRGLISADLCKTQSLAATVQRQTDGAIARYYRPLQWETLAGQYFRVQSILIYGSKTEVVPLPSGRLKEAIMRLIPDRASRFFTNRCRMGSFLVSSLEKP